MHQPGHFAALSPAPLLATCAVLLQMSCDRPHQSQGERLARHYCGACHVFPEPDLLDKSTWQQGVLPQMAARVGVHTESSFADALRNPDMMVLPAAVSGEDWERIVRYYREAAPRALPPQSLPAQPQVDPGFFAAQPLVPRIERGAIISIIKIDTTRRRLFVGEAGPNRLHVVDWNRRTVSSLTLGSPPTDLIIDGDDVLVLESGILHPNDQPRGSLACYRRTSADSLEFGRVLIDSLFRPVFVHPFDVNRDGVDDYLIAEYGNNRGRLALYRSTGTRYERQVLDPTAGAIRAELHDLTGDGAPDVVALFGQGDERIVAFPNDGRGNFGRPRLLARFPPVYGSMYFTMRDFNGDRQPDIVYVNGDNFDYSRVPKPYHGVRILENDGRGAFHERFFFPIYGAARAEVADFDRDGDLDILATSNFADRQRHAERGIMFLENAGGYDFRPFAFSIASSNRWNLTTAADLNQDGRLDVVVGAMDLDNIANLQRRVTRPAGGTSKHPLLFFENRMRAESSSGAR